MMKRPTDLDEWASGGWPGYGVHRVVGLRDRYLASLWAMELEARIEKAIEVPQVSIPVTKKMLLGYLRDMVRILRGETP